MITLLLSLLVAAGPTPPEPPADAASPSSLVPAPAPPVGTIAGRVSYSSRTPLRFKTFDNDIDPEACGDAVKVANILVDRRNGLAGVFLELRLSGGALLPDAELPVSEQALEVSLGGCAPTPHVLVVPLGSRLELQNPDGVLHEITGIAARNRSLDVTVPRYRRRLLLPPEHFRREEKVKLLCDRHSWMSGWWVITDNARHVLTGSDGSFSFGDLPAGTYIVKAWHEELGEHQEEVVLGPDEQFKLNFRFSPN